MDPHRFASSYPLRGIFATHALEFGFLPHIRTPVIAVVLALLGVFLGGSAQFSVGRDDDLLASIALDDIDSIERAIGVESNIMMGF